MSEIRELVEQELGCSITDAQFEAAHTAALKKLQHILHLYGDSDGARRSADYLVSLVAEACVGHAYTEFTLAITNALGGD